ncbi:MAG: MFS transporter [Anaerolineae bacterium]|nr:MFS transporter [Anaerolineae bacterium]
MSDPPLVLKNQPNPGSLALQIGMAGVGQFFLNAARRFVYPFAPAFSRGLGVPLTSITSLIAINQATGLVSPLFGPLTDRWGYRTMIVLSLGVVAVGLVAAGLLPVYGMILLALFLAGIGKGIFGPAIQAYIGERVPYYRRGLFIGLVEFAWAGSSLIGIPLAGWLIARFGLQAPFLVLGAGCLLSAIGLGILMPANNKFSHSQPAKPSYTMNWHTLRRSRAAWGALSFSLLISLANDNLFVILGVWLESFNLSVAAVGFSASVIGVAELIGELMTASIADRLGLRRAVYGGLFLAAIAYVALPLTQASLPLALAGIFCLFLFFEFTVVTSLSLFTEVLPQARATMMSALVAANGIGRIAGALIGSLLWRSGGMIAIGLFSAVISLLALGCLWWGMRAE